MRTCQILPGICLGLALLAPPVKAQSFRVAPTYPIGPFPSSARIADFNRDGVPDVVFTGRLGTYPTLLTILFGSAAGGPPRRVDYGAGGTEVAVADFNGDAKPDLGVSARDTDTSVTIFLGDGAGGFTTSVLEVGAGGKRTCLTAADFDNDELVDLAVGTGNELPGQGGSVQVLLGNGLGGFTTGPTIPNLDVRGIGRADFNRDGRMDLLVAFRNPSIAEFGTFLGTGSGFSLRSQFEGGGSFAFGDFNGDGIPDLVNSAGSTTAIRLGDGTGAFTPPSTQSKGGPLAVADFDGDANDDFAVLEPTGQISLFLGQGNGSFSPPSLRELGTAAVSLEVSGVLLAGHLNGDGRVDLASGTAAASSTEGHATILLASGNVDFVAAPAYRLPETFPFLEGHGVVAADLNDDAIPDLVSGNARLLGNGSGEFGAPAPYAYFSPPILDTSAGRLNGDTHTDLVVTRGSYNIVSVFLGDGTGDFPVSTSYSFGSNTGNPVLADFDRDGDTDVVVTGAHPGTVWVLLGNGDGTLGPPAGYALGGFGAALTAGDVNGDGNLDLMVAVGAAVKVLLGNGTGGFVESVSLTTPFNTARVIAADFNEDSHLDLAASNPGNAANLGKVSVWLGDGSGGFGPRQDVYDARTTDLVTSDFNLDGHLDLTVAQNTYPQFRVYGSVVILLGNGAGGFTPSHTYPISECDLESADFDRDGRRDLACFRGRSIWILRNTTIGVVTASDVTAPEGNGTGNVELTVSLAPAGNQPVTVNYATANGTATAGVDYVATSGTLVFPPGTTSRTIVVSVLGDRIAEPDETVLVSLGGPPGVDVGDGQVVLTLTNDDPAGLSMTDRVVTESLFGATSAGFLVNLSPISSQIVTVNYTTSPGTATPGADYTTTSGQLTFAPGATSQPISVPILSDSLVEGVESFTVDLSGAVNADIAYASGAGLIQDPPPGADFNADSLADLVWRHDISGENVVWFMDGAVMTSGTFTNPSTLVDPNWKIVGTNDFNADGKADFLWRHLISGENVVWFMDGVNLTGGTFTTPSALADVNWKMVGTGDFNLDGRPDILWRHDVSGENVLWYMNGTVLTGGTFTTPPALVDGNWNMAGVGDFNRDGKPDVLWHHRASGQIVLWYMDGSILTGGTFTDPSQLNEVNWRIVAVGDYNADDRPDIVWRHQVSGQNVVWFMNGPTLIGGTFTDPPALADLNWKLVGPR